MGDVALYSTVDGGELSVEAGNVQIDNGLSTAVRISLLTDTNTDGKGFWGDAIVDHGGSRLHEITRNTSENRVKAVQYIKQSLKWMLDDGIAKAVNVSIVSFSSTKLDIRIQIVQPDENDMIFIYEKNWVNQKEDISCLP